MIRFLAALGLLIATIGGTAAQSPPPSVGITVTYPYPGCVGPGCTAANLITANGGIRDNSYFNQVAAGGYNITGTACGIGNWWCSFVYASSAGTLNALSNVNTFTIQDQVLSSSNVYGVSIAHNVAPNGNTASGGRVGLNVSLNYLGTSQLGSVSNVGIGSGSVITALMSSNAGGTATAASGAINGLNVVCGYQTGGTFGKGCSGIEIDTSYQAGTSVEITNQLLMVSMNTAAIRGYLNSDSGINMNNVSGGLATTKFGLKFGDSSGDWPIDQYGILNYGALSHGGTMLAAAERDFSAINFKACYAKNQFHSDCTLQASGIAAATRLTTDGAAASSFLYDLLITATGSAFTAYPTVTFTNCTGAVAVGTITGGVIDRVGVTSPGTGCKPEATASVTGGGGAGATVTTVVAGNSLNFAINSTVLVSCILAANSTTNDSIGWSLSFGASMGATASTTAIVGTPAWTQTFASSGAAAKIAIANPTADTALGAINITVTPSAGTWTVGGNCNMTKSTTR